MLIVGTFRIYKHVYIYYAREVFHFVCVCVCFGDQVLLCMALVSQELIR